MVNKILKIGAAWCGQCRVLSGELQGFDKVPILEFDADENQELCNDYNVRNIPLLIFLNENDEEIYRNVGFINKVQLESKINELNETSK